MTDMMQESADKRAALGIMMSFFESKETAIILMNALLHATAAPKLAKVMIAELGADDSMATVLAMAASVGLKEMLDSTQTASN